MRVARWPAVSIAAVALLPARAAQARDVPRASVALVTKAPVVDGRLDDPAWQAAAPQGDFVERKPTLGAEPPVNTTFWVLLDADALYVAVRCDDDDAAAIEARNRTRDGDAIFRDDAVSIKLDPQHDRRTTFGFVLNPAGARLDYLGVNESDFRIEYDTPWEGAATRDSRGWSAEFRIPFASLGIDRGAPPHTIGFNISRDHARRNATYDWALLAPPHSPIAASRYGVLEGLDALAAVGDGDATSFAIMAHALSGLRRTPVATGATATPGATGELGDETLITGGVDLKASVGRVRGHISVNTDFAQVDLDNQVVNLTRFGLFLPEKRDFFLEDLEVFELGRSRQAQMLYSRRIGLDDQGEVPILVGNKIVGGVGKLRYGVLQVTTRPERDQPWTSHGAGRVRVDLGAGSNAGMMVTHRQSLDNAADNNAMVGVDATWRGDDVPLSFEGFGMGSLTGSEAMPPQTATGGAGELSSDRFAPGGGATLALKDPLIQPSVSYAYYHPELRGDLGFFERVGIHRGDAALEIEPRIDAGGLSKLEVGGSGKVIADAAGDALLDWRATAYTTLYWNAGYSLGAIGSHTVETVLAPFSVGRATTVAAGEHRMWIGTLSAATPETLAFSVAGTFTGRMYYGGTLLEGTLDSSWAPTSLVRFDVGGIYDHVTFDAPSDAFDSLVVNGRASFGFDNTIGLRLFGGYNLLGDVLQLQSRVRWIFVPGSDLIIVQQIDLDDASWRAKNVSLLAKTSFRLDLL